MGFIDKIRPNTITMNEQVYQFAMNTEKNKCLHIQKAAELNKYSLIFVDNAYDVHLKRLPECCSVYILQSDLQKTGCLDRLINTIILLAKKYAETLEEEGYDLTGVSTTDIYLGCEKEASFQAKIRKK